MASLTGASIASSYTSLLKLNGNTDSLVAGNNSNAIQVVDGNGDASPLYLNTDRLGIGGQPSVPMHIYVNDTTKWQSTIEQDGTGDAALKFSLTGARDWLIGLDNSDGDKFKIGYDANDLNDLNALTIDTSGNVGIVASNPGAVTPNGYAGSNGMFEVRAGASGNDAGVLIRRFDNSGDGLYGLDLWTDTNQAYNYIDSRGNLDGANLYIRTKTAGTPVNAIAIKGTGDIDYVGDANYNGSYIVNEQGRQNHVANTMSSPYYRFDGVDDKIASTETFQTTFRNSFSISALVRFEDGQPSAKQTIFGLYDGTSGVESVQLLLLTNGTLRFIFTIDSNSATFTSSAVFGDGDTGWNHIVAVADESSDTIGIYLNGNSLGTTSTSSHVWTDYTSSQPPWIGARNLNGGWNEGMQGSIQNVKVWNKYLTASEIKDDYSFASVPFKYKGANQTDLASGYDFTSGFATINATVQDANTFRTNASATGSVRKDFGTKGKRTRIRIAGTTPSGCTVKVVGTDTLTDHSGSLTGTFDSTFEFTNVDTGYRIQCINTNGTVQDTDITTYTITEIGAVAEYDGSGIASDKWMDKSGNDLHGTVSGSTVENAPSGDDGLVYEEGTWTPRIGGTGGESGQAYSTQDGSYVRIGNIVHLQGQITLSTLGTITTQARIEDLPFTSNGTYDALLKIYHGGMSTGFSNLVGRIDQGSTSASLVGFDSSAANPTNITQSHLSATTSFRFSGTYQL